MLTLVGGLRGLASALGGAALAAAISILVYEGLPLGPLRLVPLLGPVLEIVADGRVDRVRREGAVAERRAWEETRRRMLAEMAEERRKAQGAIATAERAYLEKRDRDAETIRSLEAAISEQEKADAEAGGDACVMRSFIGRGLRDRLDQVGR
ncbi:hypothetical protein NA8A_04085 [Nitratireductor indicus C115]|uniref:Uncharacterized protein n=1 Tax=Nitratireductor indicus C115 TaxID=1231190 RepID=K2P1B8_9HYPH|nr:hypothetical protein [Nitratireductor indicus]EKF43959.1 hypothetical protein NA8A_04085 [Nitratireductor indicus C115]SFQ13316.1 hypothetical protein SAMN05216176_101498 [Nitratireductor indicus]